jgi:hypothetical protein
MFILQRRKVQETADKIEIESAAARGEPKDLKKMVTKMRRE